MALLLLRSNEPVSSEVLVEQLWVEAPPPTAQKMLHNEVAPLWRVLGGEARLETRSGGYQLRLARRSVEGELALGRHADLVAELEAAVAEQLSRERLRGHCSRPLQRSTTAIPEFAEQVGHSPQLAVMTYTQVIQHVDPRWTSKAGSERRERAPAAKCLHPAGIPPGGFEPPTSRL